MSSRTDLPAGLLGADGNPSASYQAYLKHKQAWEKSKTAYNDAYAAAQKNPMQLQMWPMQGKLLQDAVDAAWHAWQTAGKKEEVERMLNS